MTLSMNLFKKSSLRRFVFATLLGFASISSLPPIVFAQPAEPPATPPAEEVEKPRPAPSPKPPSEDPDDQPRSSRQSRRSYDNNFPFADHHVGLGEYRSDAVSIGGSNLVEGDARTAVAIF
jgi:hypothetical protein